MQQSDLDSLQVQMALYEKGDYDKLEELLSSMGQEPTRSFGDLDEDDITITSESDVMDQFDEYSREPSVKPLSRENVKALVKELRPMPPMPSTFSGTEPESEPEAPRIYPDLSDDKRGEIASNTRKWIQLADTLEQMQKLRNKMNRERRDLEKDLMNDIETYGLRDITKGEHKLIPKIRPGRKKAFSKTETHNKIRDFLNTMDIVDNPNEIADHLMAYLDNSRERRQDKIQLQHFKLGGGQ